MVEITALSPGQTVGHMVLLSVTRHPTRKGLFWMCRCDCGRETKVYAGHLKSGKAKSCGCIKGAHRTHEMSHTPEYKAWDNARSRCYRKSDTKFKHYGERGITMCDAWRSSFETFLSDMGRRPSADHSIDRVDNDGNYEPGNCRWATLSEQNLNRRPFKRMRRVADAPQG